MVKNSEFKLGKSVLLLFLFQISIGIAGAFSLYVLTDLVKLLPTSMDNSHSLGMIGTIIGSLYFGQWMEKRHPGVLNEKKIKKLSLLCTMINGILALLVFFALLYSDGKPVDLGGLGFAIAFMLFILILVYFVTKYFISRGIKNWQKRKVKLQLEN